MWSITQLYVCNYMLYSRSKDYMFRPVVTIIRSLSFDTLNKILLSVSNDKDLMMVTTGRNM